MKLHSLVFLYQERNLDVESSSIRLHARSLGGTG